MPKLVSSRPRVLPIGLLLGALLLAQCLPAVGASHQNPNVVLEWQPGTMRFYAPMAGYATTDGDTYCAGTVVLTFSDGSVRTLVSVWTDPTDCRTSDPCFVYDQDPTGTIQDCAPNPLLCCFMVYVPVGADVQTSDVLLGCWGFLTVRVDVDGDGTYDHQNTVPYLGACAA